MQVSGLSNLGAPLLTGQFADNAGARAGNDTITRVRPAVGARDADAQRSEGPPAQFWRTLNGGPDPTTHIAPPSIMQIKITQMLDEQATALGNADDDATMRDGADADTPLAANADSPPAFGDEPSDETAETGAGPSDDAAAPPSPARSGYEDSAQMMRDNALPIEA